MPLFHIHRETVHRYKFRSKPLLTFAMVTGFLKDLVEHSHVGTRSEEPAYGVADTPSRFIGCATT